MRRCAGGLVLALGLAGCADPDINGLDRELSGLRENPGELNVDPLPEVPGYTALSYDQADKRSPFVPRRPETEDQQGMAGELTPDLERPREPLEAYPLESLELVGILTVGSRPSALIKAPGGQVHRLHGGDYIGTDNGRIVAITDRSVQLVEVVSNGRGGWTERSQRLELTATGRQ